MKGKVPAEVLLDLVHRACASPQVSGSDAAHLISDFFGDTVVVLERGTGSADVHIAAIACQDDETAEVWRAALDGTNSLLRGGLGQPFILGRPRSLPVGPWPGPDGPLAQVLVVPLIKQIQVLGVLAVIRDPADPPFSEAEELAVGAVASHAGMLSALDGLNRAAADAREESNLLWSSLRFIARTPESDLAIQPLLVQARHALGSAAVLLLLPVDPSAPLRLVAGSGPRVPVADPGLNWVLDSHGPIASCLRTGRTYYFAAHSGLDFAGSPLERVLDEAPSALLAAPVNAGMGTPGALIVSWPPGTVPSPDRKALANHVAELASLLVSHGRLTRESVGARAAERIAAELAAQRDAIVRQMVHDLRNSVHALGLAAEEAELRADDPIRVRAALGTVLRQADFMSAYLKEQIRSLEDQPLGSPEPASLAVAFGRLQKLSPRLQRDGRFLKIGALEPVRVKLPQVQLDQILEHLVFEASKIARPGGTLEVWGAVSDGWATIVVEDDGPGLDFNEQAKLASSRRKRRGRAEGIRIVEDLVAAAGGQFAIHSRAGESTAFHLGLPSVDWAGGA